MSNGDLRINSHYSFSSRKAAFHRTGLSSRGHPGVVLLNLCPWFILWRTVKRAAILCQPRPTRLIISVTKFKYSPAAERLMLNNANEMSSFNQDTQLHGRQQHYACKNKKKSKNTHTLTHIHEQMHIRFGGISCFFLMLVSINMRLTSVSVSARWGKYLSFVAICTVDSQRPRRHIHTHAHKHEHTCSPCTPLRGRGPAPALPGVKEDPGDALLMTCQTERALHAPAYFTYSHAKAASSCIFVYVKRVCFLSHSKAKWVRPSSHCIPCCGTQQLEFEASWELSSLCWCWNQSVEWQNWQPGQDSKSRTVVQPKS